MEDPMATQTQRLGDRKPELNDLGRVAVRFVQYGANASANVLGSLSDMSVYNWIRLIMVVGAYVLFRPYIIRIMSGKAVAQMERDDKLRKAKAQLSPNDLRGGAPYPHPDEPSDDEEDEPEEASNWGAKAKTRQRMMLKRLVEEDEKRRQEEDDDQDIADLLED